jgi:hypothetical protein
MQFVYYESIKGELKRRPMHECRCDTVRDHTDTNTKVFYFALVLSLNNKQQSDCIYYESIKQELK